MTKSAPLVCILAIACVAIAAAEEPTVVFDFDMPGALRPFGAGGKIEVAKVEIPSPAPEVAAGAPAGWAARVKAQPNSTLYTKPGVFSIDWEKQQELAFWVFLPKQNAAGALNRPATLEVRLVEDDGRAWFWRKVEVPATGWTEVKLPLAWFRVGGGRVPQWDKVVRLVIAFRSDAELWIDSIALTPGSSLRNVDQLRQLAFGDADEKSLQIVDEDDLLLLTNAPDLDANKLADHLRKVNAAVRHDLPFLPKTGTRPTLIVFATREEYENFTPRFARKLAGEAAPPRSGGFTVEGIATSYWDPKQGTLRPVYTHEYVHSLLHHLALVPNSGEWFQEGLATRYQLKFHPQANYRDIVRTGIANASLRDPLTVLTSGRPIAQTRYWQAESLHDLLLRNARRYERMLAAIHSRGSTQLEPLLEDVYQIDAVQLEEAWKKHAAP